MQEFGLENILENPVSKMKSLDKKVMIVLKSKKQLLHLLS